MPHDRDPLQGFSPAGQLLSLICGYWVTQAIYVAAELGIADLLSRRPRPVEELARATQTDGDALYRVLRALAGVGVVAEPAPRQFAITAMSVLLREDTPGNLRAFSRFQGEAWHWGCWGDILASVRSGTAAITLRHQAANCFEYLTEHPPSEKVFNDAMSAYSSQVNAALLDAYDFGDASLIADVGGGTGTLLAMILAAAPQANGVLLDRPQVITGAARVLDEHGVAPRCQLLGGDFFAAVPAAADIYLLSAILHDWEDEPAAAILRQIAAAMAPTARLLIVENILPADDQAHPGKLIDLEMMLVAGGRERTEPQFTALLANAGLVVSRIIATAMSVSILEARRA